MRRRIDRPAALPPVRIGWAEWVSLPELGLERLAAKIDTGARTSALHVTALEQPGLGFGPLSRTLHVVLPPLARRGERRVIQVSVVDWVEVRDTSGRRERRPIVETLLELGPLRRRIRLSLTDRGDMRYPMLVGRTALATGVLVDPAARHLLDAPTPPEVKASPRRPGSKGRII